MATNDVLRLIDNGSATGGSRDWAGGEGTFIAIGTFNGATVALERLGPDDTTWVPVGSLTSFTSPGMGNFTLGKCQLRAAVSNGTPANVYAEVIGTST